MSRAVRLRPSAPHPNGVYLDRSFPRRRRPYARPRMRVHLVNYLLLGVVGLAILTIFVLFVVVLFALALIGGAVIRRIVSGGA